MIINQTLQDFRSYINTNRGIAKSNRFVIELLDPNLIRRTNMLDNYIYRGGLRDTKEHLEFSARAASLPSKTLSTNAVEAPGPEQKYPYNDVYDDLTITFMATIGKNPNFGIPEKRFFDAWMNIVVNPENMLVNYSKLYTTNGFFISLISEQNEILAKYRFDRLYPIGMSAVELSHEVAEPSTFKVTFSCDRWHYVTDPEDLEVKSEPITKPRVDNETLKTSSNSSAIPKRWNPKFETFGPALPGQIA